MAPDRDRQRISAIGDERLRTSAALESATTATAADVVSGAILERAGPNLPGIASALAKVDGYARTRLALQLQRTHGNAFVQRLVQRAADQARAGDGAAPAGPVEGWAPQPARSARGVLTVQRAPADGGDATATSDPLDDERTKWVDGLPMGIRSSVDNISSDLESKMRDLGRLAAGGKARAPRRLTAAERADPQAALAALRTGQADTWAANRAKFMDYMAPSLGGDDGVKAYFTSLVSFGSSELFVHPEVGRRLMRVEEELKATGLPMPQTSVGFSARGDHVHDKSKRKRKSQGMLAHAMGLALDYFAYKNVHLTDARLRAVLEAVTERAPNMELPEGALRTIVQSGEAKMGEGSVDEAKWKAVERKIGEEFDSLVAASDAVEVSLGPLRGEVITRHEQLMALRDERKSLKAAAKRAPKAKKAEAEAAVAAAEAAVAAAEADLRARLPVLFRPWLDKIDSRINQLKAGAEEQDVDLEQISTDEGLKDLSRRAGAALKPGKAALSRAASGAKRAAEAAAGVARRVDGSLEAIEAGRVPKGATDAEIDTWSSDLKEIRARAADVMDEAVDIGSQAADVLGTTQPSQPKLGKEAIKRFKGATEVDSLGRRLDGARTRLVTATESLAKGQAAAPGAADLADDLRERKAANAAAKAQVGPKAFERLQEDKRDLFWLRQAAKDLVNDLDFMFKDASVKDPGAAQLLGGMEGKYGGGGFFGPTDRSAGTEEGDDHYSESGFNRQFFQTMASYGFEIAATWTTSDAMHFELEGLVDQIVPPGDAEADPVGARARGEAFVDKAVTSRNLHDQEQAAP